MISLYFAFNKDSESQSSYQFSWVRFILPVVAGRWLFRCNCECITAREDGRWRDELRAIRKIEFRNYLLQIILILSTSLEWAALMHGRTVNGGVPEKNSTVWTWKYPKIQSPALAAVPILPSARCFSSKLLAPNIICFFAVLLYTATVHDPSPVCARLRGLCKLTKPKRINKILNVRLCRFGFAFVCRCVYSVPLPSFELFQFWDHYMPRCMHCIWRTKSKRLYTRVHPGRRCYVHRANVSAFCHWSCQCAHAATPLSQTIDFISHDRNVLKVKEHVYKWLEGYVKLEIALDKG